MREQGRLNLLRTFTQARNQRRLDVPNDTVSAFLGDDLSVHHNNYFGASWGARSSSAGSSGGGTGFDIVGIGAAGGGTHAQFAYGRQQRHQQPQMQGVMGRAGDGGGGGLRAGSRDSLFQKTRNIMSLGDLRGAAAAVVAASAPTEGSKKSARQNEREDSAGALAALLAGSGHGQMSDALFTDAGTPASTHESTTEPMESDSPSGESTERPDTGTSAGGAAASHANNSGGALPGSTNSPHFLRDALEQQIRQQGAHVQGLGKRAPPQIPFGEAVGGMAGMRRPPAAVGGGGAGVGLGGIGAKSTSALEKLVQEQDRGQAVRTQGG